MLILSVPYEFWVPAICRKVHAAVFFVMTERLMEVSKDLDIIMNAQFCCGTVQDLCIAIWKKYFGMLVWMTSSVPCGPHCPVCVVVCVLEDGLPSRIQPRSFCLWRLFVWPSEEHIKGHELRLNGDVRPQISSGFISSTKSTSWRNPFQVRS
jgi:hypothetical protein